jgi:hypothetical protein
MSIGQPLSTADFTGYLMKGLDEDKDIYAQMLATEQRMEGRKVHVQTDMHMSENIGSCSSPQGGKQQYQQYTPNYQQKHDPRRQPSPLHHRTRTLAVVPILAVAILVVAIAILATVPSAKSAPNLVMLPPIASSALIGSSLVLGMTGATWRNRWRPSL